jgi:hypothetical protein
VDAEIVEEVMATTLGIGGDRGVRPSTTVR